MLDFDFSERDKEKYIRKARKRLDEAGVTFLRPDPSAIGARGWDCTTKKADAVIVHMMPYPKGRWTRKKEAQCREVKGWRIQKQAVPANGWRGHTMAPEVPETVVRSRIEFTDGRGRHGTES